MYSISLALNSTKHFFSIILFFCSSSNKRLPWAAALLITFLAWPSACLMLDLAGWYVTPGSFRYWNSCWIVYFPAPGYTSFAVTACHVLLIMSHSFLVHSLFIKSHTSHLMTQCVRYRTCQQSPMTLNNVTITN